MYGIPQMIIISLKWYTMCGHQVYSYMYHFTKYVVFPSRVKGLNRAQTKKILEFQLALQTSSSQILLALSKCRCWFFLLSWQMTGGTLACWASASENCLAWQENLAVPDYCTALFRTLFHWKQSHSTCMINVQNAYTCTCMYVCSILLFTLILKQLVTVKGFGSIGVCNTSKQQCTCGEQ